MPTVTEWLEQGDLTMAIKQAQENVADRPRAEGERFLLFELTILQEDFEEAMVQLNMLRELSPQLSDAAEFYLGLVEAELRRNAFLQKGDGGVGFVVEPPDWAGDFCRACQSLLAGRGAEASSLLQEAWRKVPPVSGTLNGEREFTSFRDADDVLGPFLEAIVPGAWLWMPFSQIQSVSFTEPKGYQEIIWRPAEVVMRNGWSGEVWVPSVYSGTGERTDHEKLGRMTMFDYPAPGISRGYGQRDFKIDDGTLMGIQSVKRLEFRE